MLTREDVVYAYRLILGREPESEEAIEAHRRSLPNIEALRQTFLRSEELDERLRHQLFPIERPVGRHYMGEPISVQINGPADQLQRMFDRTAGVWRDLGETEPHWSVLSDPQFTADRIAETEGAFYGSGAYCRNTLLAFLARNGIVPDSDWSVLELGCGTGRITWALAETFRYVTGVDVSAPHLDLARRYCGRKGIRNTTFRRIGSVEALSDLPCVDLFFSLIVLQHNPPPIIRAMLAALLSRVAPGGYAFFQVPTYAKGYRFDWDEYLADDRAVMEMHALPQPAVYRLLSECGFDLIEAHEDEWAGAPSMISMTFLAQRRPA